MSQDFHGNVGQVAAGDIQNLDVKIHMLGKTEDKGLVPAQRKELHALRSKCEELGDDARDVWRMVHAQLGVTTISEISAEQFSEARMVMQGRLDQLLEEADKRRLIGKILRMSTEKDAGKEVVIFCERTFGRTQFKSLKRSELQQVFDFIQGFELVVQPDVDSQPQTSQVTEALTFQDLLRVYRKQCGAIFFLGVAIGHYLF